jgi:hypothetical protein
MEADCLAAGSRERGGDDRAVETAGEFDPEPATVSQGVGTLADYDLVDRVSDSAGVCGIDPSRPGWMPKRNALDRVMEDRAAPRHQLADVGQACSRSWYMRIAKMDRDTGRIEL